MMDIGTLDLVSLVGSRTQLRRKAGTHGGEYSGSCPLCGGRDRLIVQASGGSDGRGLWTCRHCRNFQWGDAIDFVMWYDGVGFRDACDSLGFANAMVRPLQTVAPEPIAPSVCTAPSDVWQASAEAFLAYCFDYLWGKRPRPILDYLAQRGIPEDVAQWATLGYNPTPLYRPVDRWGVDGEVVWLPAGIVFPWFVDGVLWKLNIRQLGRHTGDKYITVKGSGNAPYLWQTLESRQPTVLVEGVFDALAVAWATKAHSMFSENQRIGVLAVGTTQARNLRWIHELALSQQVLVALDHDEAGDQASRYWLDVLGQRATRWRPYLNDCGAMAEAGMDVGEWLTCGFDQSSHHQKAA